MPLSASKFTSVRSRSLIATPRNFVACRYPCETPQLTSTSHNKTEILKLPLELRKTIYEMVLAPEDSCPITDAKKRLTNHEFEHENDSDYCECSRESAVEKYDMSIVLTCKQIYEEAIKVLHQTRTVSLFVGRYSQAFGYELDESDDLSFQSFRKVFININCLKEMYAEYGLGPRGTIGYMFYNLASKIITQIDSARSKKEVHFEFALWPEEQSLHLDAREKMRLGFWTDKLWIRVQSAELVKRLRAELDSALGKDTVILTSNVESDVAKIDTVRQSATVIRFHHHESGKKGILRRALNPASNMPIFSNAMRMKLDDNTK